MDAGADLPLPLELQRQPDVSVPPRGNSLASHIRRIAEHFDAQAKPAATITTQVTRRTLMATGAARPEKRGGLCSSAAIACWHAENVNRCK